MPAKDVKAYVKRNKNDAAQRRGESVRQYSIRPCALCGSTAAEQDGRF